MTSFTNEGAFGELWYTLKAIKLVTGVTPRCWRVRVFFSILFFYEARNGEGGWERESDSGAHQEMCSRVTPPVRCSGV
jgi:hypothetical protein